MVGKIVLENFKNLVWTNQFNSNLTISIINIRHGFLHKRGIGSSIMSTVS